MRIITIITILVVSNFQILLGCGCESIPEIETYDYIAFVEIDNVNNGGRFDNKLNDGVPKPRYHEVNFNTIKHFKGEFLDTVNVWGGNYKYDLGMTSCDLNISIGQKWLLFGNLINNEIFIGYCSLSVVYENEFGEKNHQSKKSINLLDKLLLHFNMKSEKKNFFMGNFYTYYPNGQIECIETYINGEIIGERVVYFSNGQIMLRENYVNGKIQNEIKWWYRNGNLSKEAESISGDSIVRCKYYRPSGKLNRINYFQDGILIRNGKYKSGIIKN